MERVPEGTLYLILRHLEANPEHHSKHVEWALGIKLSQALAGIRELQQRGLLVWNSDTTLWEAPRQHD